MDELRVAPVTIGFPRPVVGDVAATTQHAVAEVLASGSLPAGAEVGITVGSCGIANIAAITRAAIGCDRRGNGRPGPARSDTRCRGAGPKRRSPRQR